MKKKILITASTSDHLMNFHLPYIESLKQQHKVYTMARDVNKPFADFNINFTKKIFSFKNFTIVKQIRTILKREKFDVIFLNTSLAAFFVRLAMIGLKNKPKTINIVHGYLFGEKTNILKKCVFLLAEKLVKKQTMDIVVMNGEDYCIAKKHKLCKGNVYKINGMGINEKRFNNKETKNDGLEKMVKFSFIGELSSRKNQIFLLKFIKKLEKYDIEAHLSLIGVGGLQRKIERKIKSLKLENKVTLVGFTDDIEKHINQSNYYICASKIEGLPFNILEAMYAGSVVFSSDIKGTADLIDDLENGVLFKLGDLNDLISKFRIIKNDLHLQEKLRKNAQTTAKQYLLSKVFTENTKLFNDLVVNK